ncbi:enolase C-terminal domain-like protein [Yinghuangia seranimata]|uniref:enolase C-terminal domain-like protein n=1 Tax=Yinghuangia seranimata TaxID=408067 RepID=UPI00248B80A7|nr:enolase C-terminal domain-like protein [Yinghuangia seranimata]MDI2129485.1 enolase C-terminal domain-like protein [Yinghuangia seranimata]
MRITDVTIELVDLPAQPPFRWRAGLPGSEPAVVGGILRVHTDEGLVGEAHTRRGVIVADLVARRIREDLVGRDPLARELLWERLWELDRIEEFPIYALGLVDVALWDLAGKATAQPVHRLLGTYREAIPAYASTVTFGSVEEYLDVATQCLELGYVGIKLHAWGNPAADADLCRKLREHVGPDVPLMYDGSAGFDLADSIALGHVLAEAGYIWYEEPMREFSVTAYRRLAERVAVPLLVAETSDGAHMNTGDFIAAGAAGGVRTSAQYKGGITGAMRIAHLADSYQLRAEVHGSGVVNAHLCMAIPNTTYYESLVYTNPVVREPSVGADGLVQAPTAPGVGFDQPGW